MSNLFSKNLPTEESHLAFGLSTDAPILSIWHTSKIKYTTKNRECQIYFSKVSQKRGLLRYYRSR